MLVRVKIRKGHTIFLVKVEMMWVQDTRLFPSVFMKNVEE